MLESTRIQTRQSEIREKMATLQVAENLTNEQRSEINTLGTEYRDNEARFRASLITEDEQREQAGKALETRESNEWGKLVAGFELRQAALHLDEGRALDGATAEIVQELRSRDGYRGVPVPFEALEQRAGETVSGGIPDPVATKPIIDRLFPQSVAGAMGARMINIASGSQEYPISTSAVTVGWASTEGGDVAGPTAYTTSNRNLAPDQTLGVQMQLTRKAMKQAGGIEQAIRRDMRGAMGAELDKAVFLGTGASGQPAGVIAKASTYGIASTSIGAAASYGAFRTASVAFMQDNAATGPGSIRALIRPEAFDNMDAAAWDAGSGITEYDRLKAKFGSVVLSANVLAAPTGSPKASKALLTTNAGGVSPIFIGTWGAVDLIRDPYSDAQSGGLRLTALVTLDVTVSRAEQLQVLTGLQ